MTISLGSNIAIALLSTSNSAKNIQLPLISTCPGRIIYFKDIYDITNNSNSITLLTSNNDVFENSLSNEYKFTNKYQAITLYANPVNNNWNIISFFENSQTYPSWSGISSLSSIVSYGLSSLGGISGLGLSSLSSIVSYGLSTLSKQPNQGVSSLSSIVSYGLSSLGGLGGPGISSLSSIVSYSLSTVARQPNPGLSSLSSIVSYGLSSIIFQMNLNITTSNFLTNSNSEIDYAPIGTIPPVESPSNYVTPLNLDFAISSVNTYYQYSNVFIIDEYNVTLSSTTAFYTVDSNYCYGCGFSNEIDPSYATVLVLIAGWSNQTGFFDVYNQADIPITFQSEYPNEGVTINPFTNSRMIFNGPLAVPPIDQEPITSEGLTPVYISSFYNNATYFKQLVTGITLEIDLSGTDVNNNPITGLGTFGINATLDLCNNNIQTVNQISVDNISTSTTGSTSFQNDINMVGYNIDNVNQISVDFIQAAYSSEIQFNSQVDLGNNLLSGVSQINVDNIATNTAEYVLCYNDINMNNNNIQTVNQISVNNIASTSGIGSVLYYNDIDMNYNNIWNANTFTIDTIQANTGSDIYFNNNVNFNNYGIDNCQAIRVDYIHANLNASCAFPDGMQVDTIGAYVTGTTTFNNDIDINYNNILTVGAINFIHGSQINETLYGGSNYLYLNAQTVTNGNVVISNGFANPTLTFDSGKQAFIDFYENFRISCNVDMMLNDISNVGNIFVNDISASNINVSTINGLPLLLNQLTQSGITTAGSTVTLPIAYSGTGSYGIQLTYTGVTDTRGYAPLTSVINSTSEFIVWGNTGTSVFWTTIGV